MHCSYNDEQGFDSDVSPLMSHAGLLGSVYMSALERRIPGTSASRVAQKVAANIVYSPVSVSLSFASMVLLLGGTISDARAKIKRDLVETVVAGLAFWPLVHAVNFKFVPVSHRVVAISAAAVVWGVYFSGQINRQ